MITFDFRTSEDYDPTIIRESLNKLRNSLHQNRNGHISYIIYVDVGTPLYPNDKINKTTQEDYLK